MESSAKTRALPFEDRAAAGRFPLGICILGLAMTGLGLIASAAGIHWGAAPVAGDALEWAWVYVNMMLLWTWLVAWPALALSRSHLKLESLLWGFAALVVAAIPAVGMAAFLSGIPPLRLTSMLALQLAAGLLALGAMAWHNRISPALIATVLVTLAVVLPVLGYLWAEFFPAASQGWLAFIPTTAVTRAAAGAPSDIHWWVTGCYALTGMGLLGTSPRIKPH